MKPVLLAIALLLVSTGAVRAENSANLASPLALSYVADPAGLLAVDTRAELDRLATTIDDAGQGQLAFVVVSDTGGQDPREFATQLLKRWGVGHAEQDDGTLFLVARNDRAAEIVLGDGIDTPENRAHLQRVMDNEMVPRLKNGDYDQALVAGATAVLQTVYTVDLSRPSEVPVDADGKPAASASKPQPLAATPHREGAKDADKGVDAGPLAIGLGILAAIVGGVGWVLYKIFQGLWWLVGSRWMPRRCGSCSTTMNLLGEAEDDTHLSPAERTEERLKSVNYRVFLCPGCGKVDKLARRAWFSSYANCSQCKSRAVSRVSRTLSAATRYSTGLAEVTETCQNCNHTATTRQTLPILPPPSTSSSSSSSSGRSFGGGSSSGGGASGRW
jgi:uncharacterized protein